MTAAIVAIVSFGYLHGPPPADADIVIDLRQILRDPHVDPAFRQLTGHDVAVRQRVLSTSGADQLLDGLTTIALGLLEAGRGLRIALGCAGGRHRSVVLTHELVDRLLDAKQLAVAVHRDIGRAVVTR